MSAKEINEIGTAALNSAFAVHTALGSGMLESIYELALAQELRDHGLVVQTQVPFQALYKGLALGVGYRLDILLENAVVLELK